MAGLSGFLRAQRGVRCAVAGIVVGALSGTPAFAQPAAPLQYQSGPEWKELGVTPPAYPKAETMIRFPTTWTTSEIFVDGATLTVGDDTVVRYVLVIRTAGGAENVTFEGLRCETGQRRIYAFGRRDQTWSPARVSEWRAIEDTRTNRQHFEFWRDVFCDGRATEPRAEIHRNLLRGGRERPQSIPSD